ncbi:MAG: DUF2867 domain-containing protein [Pseudomonadota bacterium]
MSKQHIHVRAVPLPQASQLTAYLERGDFVDCYAAPASIGPRRAAEIVVAFPAWAQLLLRLRRVLTAPFGLSNDGPEAADKLGPFPVEVETEDEVIAGFDDRHLDFRVSVMSRDGAVSLATWVRPHNLAGRGYLAAIMPFHILIARDAVARVARAAPAIPEPSP